MSDRYFREEYAYLLEEGRRFAQRYPELGRMLNLGDSRASDPNVERLLEGFAFLASRIHQRLDAEFPLLVDQLLGMLWPHLGRALPSFCLMEFTPRGPLPPEGVVVPAGAEVAGSQLMDGVRCRYRTCFPLWVPPLSVSDLQTETTGATSRLRINLQPVPGLAPAVLAGRKLRLQIHADGVAAQQLYYLLTGSGREGPLLQGLRLKVNHAGKTQEFRLPPESLIPAGLDKQQALLPRGEPLFWGFQLLTEYFLFPDKLLAVELELPAELARCQAADRIELLLELDTIWPREVRPEPGMLRLACVPAVNLFSHEGEPIRLDHLRSSYRVTADLQRPEAYQIYSVDQVVGIGLEDGQRRSYRPLLAIRNRLSGPEEDPSGPFYLLSRHTAPWGGVEYHLSVVDPQAKGTLPQPEVLSLTLTCSNGLLGAVPQPGQIDEGGDQVPELLQPANLTQPTPPCFPPPEQDPVWLWLGQSSLNHLALASAPRLEGLLRLYESRGDEANLRRIKGIRHFSAQPVRARLGGALVGGTRVELTLDEQHFTNRGDILLFARVLGRFLRAYATINSFVELQVKLSPSGQLLRLEPQLGEKGGL